MMHTEKNQKGLILLDITEAVILSPLKILNSIYLKSLYYPFESLLSASGIKFSKTLAEFCLICILAINPYFFCNFTSSFRFFRNKIISTDTDTVFSVIVINLFPFRPLFAVQWTVIL